MMPYRKEAGTAVSRGTIQWRCNDRVVAAAHPDRVRGLVLEEPPAELVAFWPAGEGVRVAEAGHIISRGRTHEQFMAHLQAFLGQHHT